MKKTTLNPSVLMPLAAMSLLLSLNTATQAQTVPENEYNRLSPFPQVYRFGDNYHSQYMRPWPQPVAVPAREAVQVPAPQQVEAPPPQRVEVVKPAERTPVRVSCSETTGGLVGLSKRMLAEVTLGQEFMYELNAVANACAGNVVITDRVPAGTAYVRSEPPAEVQGDRLIWHFEEAQPGEAHNIKVWLRAEKEGRLASCATVSADPRVCAETFVGKPLLAIVKSGPEVAQIGNDVTYNIVVSNKGTALARQVVVTDAIPDGLTHSSGQRQLSFEVGDLAPNQAKTIPVTFKAAKRGKVCNGAVAASSNAGKVSAEACTTIVQPGLQITKTTSDKELLINRAATYTIVVSNIGDVPLTGVVVTDTAAPETAIAAAPGGSASGNVATWNVGQLNPGDKKELSVKVLSRVPGQFCNTASVSTAQGLKESAQACTQWIGVTGVLVEVVDDPDPIQVGETTTFTLRITNQGATRDIEELNVKAVFQAQIDPANASAGGKISGKSVAWPTVPRLAPKQSVTYTVIGKALQPGDHRMETQVTTRLREQPIVELESTTVY